MTKWLAIPLTTAMLSGCASFNQFSGQEAATIDREQHIAELSQEMETVGFNRVEIQPGVDEFLNVCASLLERQYSVMSEFRTLAANHVDVQAFLQAHQGAAEEELKAAIIEFDAGAASEDGRIGAKIDAYNQALAAIAEKNTELALEIAMNLAQATLIIKDNAQAVAISGGASLLSGIFGDGEKTADNDLGLAILRAKHQISLASDANEIISLEQETIEQINALQAELEAKA